MEWHTRFNVFRQMIYKDTEIPVGQQRFLGGGGTILQELPPPSHEWHNVLLYRVQRTPKQDPGPRVHSDPEPTPASQHPTAQVGQPYVPDYIRNLEPIPILDVVTVNPPHGTWEARRTRFLDTADKLEESNRLLRMAMARDSRAEAEIEYTTYLELLLQVNEVLQRKETERTTDLDEQEYLSSGT
jgi:hypothetical protein